MASAKIRAPETLFAGAKPIFCDVNEDMLISIEQVIKDIHESVNDMRSVKSQIKHYEYMLNGRNDAEEIIELGKEIIVKIDEWEAVLIQSDQKTYQDVINFHNQLNAQWMNLKDYVDSADPVLTSGAIDRFNDLKAEWSLYRLSLIHI